MVEEKVEEKMEKKEEGKPIITRAVTVIKVVESRQEKKMMDEKILLQTPRSALIFYP